MIQISHKDYLLEMAAKFVHKTDFAITSALALLCSELDPFTVRHQQRVSRLATSIAQNMGLPRGQVKAIQAASLFHDIGKLKIPRRILLKPYKLDEAEMTIVKEHSQVGYNILTSMGYPVDIAQIVIQHHERLDGSGYPHGIWGNQIYFEAKVLAVADTVDAMLFGRSYCDGHTIQQALLEISQDKGQLYDRDVVEACADHFEIMYLRQAFWEPGEKVGVTADNIFQITTVLNRS